MARVSGGLLRPQPLRRLRAELRNLGLRLQHDPPGWGHGHPSVGVFRCLADFVVDARVLPVQEHILGVPDPEAAPEPACPQGLVRCP